MAVVEIANGEVIATYRDVRTLEQARKKYPRLADVTLALGDHPAGTLYANGAFSAPAIVPGPREQSDEERAIRALAAAATPAVRAQVEAILGGGPG